MSATAKESGILGFAEALDAVLRHAGAVRVPAVETVALPVANRKKMGVIAMKVMAQDALIGPAEPHKLMYYSLSLPITAVVIGMPKFDHIEENCRLAKAFKPLPASERKQMSDELSKKYKAQLDHFFSNHIDA